MLVSVKAAFVEETRIVHIVIVGRRECSTQYVILYIIVHVPYEGRKNACLFPSPPTFRLASFLLGSFLLQLFRPCPPRLPPPPPRAFCLSLFGSPAWCFPGGRLGVGGWGGGGGSPNPCSSCEGAFFLRMEPPPHRQTDHVLSCFFVLLVRFFGRGVVVHTHSSSYIAEMSKMAAAEWRMPVSLPRSIKIQLKQQ